MRHLQQRQIVEADADTCSVCMSGLKRRNSRISREEELATFELNQENHARVVLGIRFTTVGECFRQTRLSYEPRSATRATEGWQRPRRQRGRSLRESPKQTQRIKPRVRRA